MVNGKSRSKSPNAKHQNNGANTDKKQIKSNLNMPLKEIVELDKIVDSVLKDDKSKNIEKISSKSIDDKSSKSKIYKNHKRHKHSKERSEKSSKSIDQPKIENEKNGQPFKSTEKNNLDQNIKLTVNVNKEQQRIVERINESKINDVHNNKKRKSEEPTASYDMNKLGSKKSNEENNILQNSKSEELKFKEKRSKGDTADVDSSDNKSQKHRHKGNKEKKHKHHKSKKKHKHKSSQSRD